MTETSNWTALQNPVFRKMWIASLLSGTCMAAQDTAATWVIEYADSIAVVDISVVSTLASLPFFLLTLRRGP